MKVELIAHTVVTRESLELLGKDWDVTDADHLAELAGRDCYQSHDRPNPQTAENEDYVVKNLIDKQHFSVLEHGSATLRISGVSRSLTHELVRHRHFSYSQLSQRYVDLEHADYVIPPAIRDWPDEGEKEDMLAALANAWDVILDAYGVIETTLGSNPRVERPQILPRKRAREAARAVLPNMTTTIIDVTGNHRAWREMLWKRLGEGADREIQELAREILVTLSAIAPATYADMTRHLMAPAGN